MKLSDAASGLLAMVLGLAVVVRAQSFPPMPGQPIGPALFPQAIGAGLFLAGSLLVTTGGWNRPFIETDEWVRRPRILFNFALVVGDLVFYALVVERLGFLITALIFLTALFLAFGVRRTRILPLAAAVTLALHYGFYTLLRVPLPWGVLEGIAW